MILFSVLVFQVIKIIYTVVRNIERLIHSKIFNIKKFVSNLDVDRFLQDQTILPSNCERSECNDQHHKHIFTGNLLIKRNN